VGGTAQECADHIKETWRRGQRGVELVRSELIAEHGVEVADALVPMKNGGVMLLKIGSAMHDTCNTANAVVPLLAEMKELNGKEILGEEAWAALPAQEDNDGLAVWEPYQGLAHRCVQQEFRSVPISHFGNGI
jgi:hypothetical protein